LSSYPVIISNAGNEYLRHLQLSAGLPTTCFATFTFTLSMKVQDISVLVQHG